MIVLLPFSQAQAKSPGKLVDIQSITKTRVAGWIFAKGPGTRILLGIQAKIKINKDGRRVEVPVLAAYLYDRDKNLVKKIDNFLINKGTRCLPGADRFFKGKQTHVLVFPYENETKFKYYLVVAGKQGNMTASVEPGDAKVQDFMFDEKGQL